MKIYHLPQRAFQKRCIGFLFFCSLFTFFILGIVVHVSQLGYGHFHIYQDTRDVIPDHKISSNTKHYVPQIIDALDIYPNLEFEANWTKAPQYLWDDKLEERFQSYKNSSDRFPLKIIVVPHSHNDPGWGWTMEDYYDMRTKNVFREGLTYLKEHPDMRFLWSEASFLHLWWGKASEGERELFKSFVASGQVEIVTGGWVMTDEAVVHLYSMIDQLIEGNHWVKYNLNVTPKNGWSVDPFGYGSTFPYLLKNSGINSAVILRTHYAWKKWFAETQNGDFYWAPRFDLSGENSIVCHHAPYFMYLMGASLGPHTKKSTKFDFSQKGVAPIKDSELKEMAYLFLEEGGRTGSIFPHNVVLAILGEDFAYQTKLYWDTNYQNYKKLFKYINDHKELFNGVEVEFGTVASYFKAIEDRNPSLNTFIGDFFTYSDVVDPDQRAAYWSGYFSTRPFWKKLYREAENILRSAEILFSFAHSSNRFQDENESSNLYKKLCASRKLHGLFAHHDGSPGVSDRHVMQDYGNKLLKAIELSSFVQKTSTEKLLNINSENLINYQKYSTRMEPNIHYFSSIKFDEKAERDQKEIVIFNPLGWETNQVIRIVVSTNDTITLFDPNQNTINFQLNPVYKLNEVGGIEISNSHFELIFLAKLLPLSLSVFTIETTKNNIEESFTRKAKIYFTNEKGNEINKSHFEIIPLDKLNGELQLENDKMKITFDKNTGFLKYITVQSHEQPNNQINLETDISFGGYASVDHHSGPYLFRPKVGENIKFPLEKKPKSILLVLGSIVSTLVVKYDSIEHQIEIVNSEKKLNEAIYIKNTVNTNSQNGEFFMRIDTELESKTTIIQKNKTLFTPTFFTDQNGFTFEKRIKIEEIGIEGNYYPITSLAFIEDIKRNLRLSLLVDRSHGASSYENGRLEVMIERRVPYDDDRGIGQGVTDQRETISNYVLTLEQINLEKEVQAEVVSPTLHVHHLAQQLNYPPTIFFMAQTANKIEFESSSNKATTLFNYGLKEDAHLLAFRTMSAEGGYDSIPSKYVLTLIHKLGFECEFPDLCFDANGTDDENLIENEDRNCKPSNMCFEQNDEIFNYQTSFNPMLKLFSIIPTELTGLNRKGNEANDFSSLYQIKTNKYEIKSFIATFSD